MLVHGARAVLRTAEAKDKKDPFSRWALEVAKRRGRHKATLAIANKMARVGLGGVSQRRTLRFATGGVMAFKPDHCVDRFINKSEHS